MPSARNDRMRGVRVTGLFGGFLLVFWALASAGCLATSEFGLEKKEPEREEPMPSAAAPVRAVCEESERSCSGRDLLHCLSGRWQVAQRCAADETCSASLGRCTVCDPLTEYRCRQGRLERCRPEGSGFDLVEDCLAAGKTCDVQLSRDACLGCRGTDRRCGGPKLQRCSGGQFVDAGSCAFGPCQVVDGRTDYCPECPEPGREACGVGTRVVCSATLELEEIQSCPGGCAFDGGVTHCL